MYSDGRTQFGRLKSYDVTHVFIEIDSRLELKKWEKLGLEGWIEIKDF